MILALRISYIAVVAIERSYLLIESRDKLLQSLYSAPTRVDGWSTFLADLIDFSNSKSGVLTLVEPETMNPMHSESASFDAHMLQMWEEYYLAIDPWVDALNEQPDNQFYTGDSLVDPRQFRKSEMYNDFSSKMDVEHATGSCIRATNDRSGVLLTLQQSSCQGENDSATIQLLNSLVPHIQQSIALGAELNSVISETDGLLAAIDGAALIVNEFGQVRRVNEAAEALLRSNQVIGLGLNDKLGFCAQSRVRLDQHLAYCRSSRAAVRFPFTGADDEEYLLIINALIDPIEDKQWLDERFLIIVRKAEVRMRMDAVVLADVFGLTFRESDIANEMLEGESPESLAAKFGLKEDVIHGHVQSILRKSGSKSELDFVAKCNRRFRQLR